MRAAVFAKWAAGVVHYLHVEQATSHDQRKKKWNLICPVNFLITYYNTICKRMLHVLNEFSPLNIDLNTHCSAVWRLVHKTL